MRVKYELDHFVVKTEKGYVFTDIFYDLSFAGKCEVARLSEEAGLFDNQRFYDKLVKALLQHSHPTIMKEYPIKGQRKIRPAAIRADRLEANLALASHWDDLLPNLGKFIEDNFQKLLRGTFNL